MAPLLVGWQRVKLQSTCVGGLICLGNTRSACRQLGLKLQVALTSPGSPQSRGVGPGPGVTGYNAL